MEVISFEKKPSQNVVELLEQLLDLAKEGVLQSVSVASLQSNNKYRVNHAGPLTIESIGCCAHLGYTVNDWFNKLTCG